MLPYPIFEKVGHLAKLSAELAKIPDAEIQKRKQIIDDWIFDKCSTFDFKPALNLLLKTTAIAVPVTAAGLATAKVIKNDVEDVVNQAILRTGLTAAGMTALGLGAYHLFNKKASLTSATLFKALKKLATIGAVDDLLRAEKYATLRRINRAYGVQIIADMVDEDA